MGEEGESYIRGSMAGAVALVVGSIVLAYISLKLYDEPVRRYLTKRFLQVRK